MVDTEQRAERKQARQNRRNFRATQKMMSDVARTPNYSLNPGVGAALSAWGISDKLHSMTDNQRLGKEAYDPSAELSEIGGMLFPGPSSKGSGTMTTAGASDDSDIPGYGEDVSDVPDFVPTDIETSLLSQVADEYADDPLKAQAVATQLYLARMGDEFAESYDLDPVSKATVYSSWGGDGSDEFLNNAGDDQLTFAEAASEEDWYNYLNWLKAAGFDTSAYGDLSNYDTYSSAFNDYEQNDLGAAFAAGDTNTIGEIVGDDWQSSDFAKGVVGRYMFNTGKARNYHPLADSDALLSYIDWVTAHANEENNGDYLNTTYTDMDDVANRTMNYIYEYDPDIFEYMADNLTPNFTRIDSSSLDKTGGYFDEIKGYNDRGED